VQALAALADPTRIAIVELLSERDRPAGEIADRFSVSGPAISRHLRVLRESGLVAFTKDGQHRIYRLNPEPLAEAGDWMQKQLAAWHRRYDALGRHLDRVAAAEREDEE
jgi:DNA-binding transcriptional ArsR family regulator